MMHIPQLLVIFIVIFICAINCENELRLELDEPEGIYEDAKINNGETAATKQRSLKELRTLLHGKNITNFSFQKSFKKKMFQTKSI
jgi:hypothetical protein